MAILFYSELDDPVDWRREIERHEPGLDFRVWPETGELGEIDIALVWKAPPGLLKSLPNLKAILSLAAGVDHVLDDADRPPAVPIARLIDPGLTFTMTEFVLLSVLRHHRHVDRIERDQAEARWEWELPPDTRERRVGIMGLGVLGGDAATRLAAHGFRVAGWSRTPKRIENVESFHGKEGLTPFLERTEILVCLLPSTPETRNIIDARTLAALPEGAAVINTARGDHVVEADLLAALDEDHIAGATLDVFREEPLPSDHPFWAHPRVLVTPHVAAAGYPHTAAPMVADNIRRVRNGEPLRHQVDVAAGY